MENDAMILTALLGTMALSIAWRQGARGEEISLEKSAASMAVDATLFAAKLRELITAGVLPRSYLQAHPPVLLRQYLGAGIVQIQDWVKNGNDTPKMALLRKIASMCTVQHIGVVTKGDLSKLSAVRRYSVNGKETKMALWENWITMMAKISVPRNFTVDGPKVEELPQTGTELRAMMLASVGVSDAIKAPMDRRARTNVKLIDLLTEFIFGDGDAEEAKAQLWQAAGWQPDDPFKGSMKECRVLAQNWLLWKKIQSGNREKLNSGELVGLRKILEARSWYGLDRTLARNHPEAEMAMIEGQTRSSRMQPAKTAAEKAEKPKPKARLGTIARDLPIQDWQSGEESDGEVGPDKGTPKITELTDGEPRKQNATAVAGGSQATDFANQLKRLVAGAAVLLPDTKEVRFHADVEEDVKDAIMSAIHNLDSEWTMEA